MEKSSWENILRHIGRNTVFSTVTVDAYLKKLTPVKIKDNVFYFTTKDKSAQNSVTRDLRKNLIKSIKEVEPCIEDIRVDLADTPSVGADGFAAETQASDNGFNPKYTFETFVVGTHSKVANAAAYAVAQNPGKFHNPLFIYGGVGLGKTHLVHAIANYCKNVNAGMKIMYVTAEQFANDFIDSINKFSESSSSTKQFREKYRNVDMLIIDDVQFIRKKSSTQESLFHTFNDLYTQGRQIILTSDASPRELEDVEERLVSRFMSGLTADISAPDYETRILILQKKAMDRNFKIDKEILEYIADKVKSNIRELEGALSKVIFLSTLGGSEGNCTMEVAKEALASEYEESNGQITIDKIVEKVCEYYCVTKDDLKGKKRNKEIVEPRHISIYLIENMLSVPLQTIAHYFGGRDHTTIMNSRDKIKAALSKDAALRDVIDKIKRVIGN